MSVYEKNQKLEDYLRGLLKQEEEKNAQLEAALAEKEQKIQGLLVQIGKERELNTELRRISRERANADRQITPKKQHDGYLVMRSDQYIERSEDFTMEAWRSVIQTPYTVECSFAVICYVVEGDLFVDGLMKELGCGKIALGCDVEDLDNTETNTAYRILYSANLRYGFWEATIFTTGPLAIPRERLPRFSCARSLKA